MLDQHFYLHSSAMSAPACHLEDEVEQTFLLLIDLKQAYERMWQGNFIIYILN
jgi:hypothetical protein